MSATPSPRASASSPDPSAPAASPVPVLPGAAPSAPSPLLPGLPRLWLRTTPSTNDAARRWALAGAPDGALVTAHDQTAGRGQRGHTWSSPPGLGLPVSYILRPADCPASQANVWAVYGAMTALFALRALGLENLAVKYPNDILCRGKKICGILAEPRLTATRVEFVILGIGLNLLQTPLDFPPDIRPSATSCLIEGHPSSIPPVLDLLSATLRDVRSIPYPRLHTLWLRSGARPPAAP
ncbi:MAG: biotin--[Kiritimatiellae bacterium]|nr:biotin--[acetyl-CoA-carboxylase] ligase [Kiritimatiellia bacterium]